MKAATYTGRLVAADRTQRWGHYTCSFCGIKRQYSTPPRPDRCEDCSDNGIPWVTERRAS